MHICVWWVGVFVCVLCVHVCVFVCCECVRACIYVCVVGGCVRVCACV